MGYIVALARVCGKRPESPRSDRSLRAAKVSEGLRAMLQHRYAARCKA
jgi:hypothetical protein